MSVSRHVVVATGHRTDAQGRPKSRFPDALEPAVSRAVRQVLEEWSVGRGWLLLCGGARGADLIAAEHALALGADVELHLAGPVEEHATDAAVSPWRSRFDAVLAASTAVRIVDGAGDDRHVRTNRSLVARAREAAGGGPIHALAVWDGQPGDGPGGTDDMVHALERELGTGGVLRIIDPRRAGCETSIGGVPS